MTGVQTCALPILGLLKLVHAVQEQLKRKQREEQQERERARRIEEVLAEQDRLRKLFAKEKSAAVRLRDQVVRWRESQAIRDFVARVRTEGRLREQSLEGQAMEDWCGWALYTCPTGYLHGSDGDEQPC